MNHPSFSGFIERLSAFVLLACHSLTILFVDNGNSSAECFVDLESEADLRNVLKKSNSTIGNRPIEGSSSPEVRLSFLEKTIFPLF